MPDTQPSEAVRNEFLLFKRQPLTPALPHCGVFCHSSRSYDCGEIYSYCPKSWETRSFLAPGSLVLALPAQDSTPGHHWGVSSHPSSDMGSGGGPRLLLGLPALKRGSVSSPPWPATLRFSVRDLRFRLFPPRPLLQGAGQICLRYWKTTPPLLVSRFQAHPVGAIFADILLQGDLPSRVWKTEN